MSTHLLCVRNLDFSLYPIKYNNKYLAYSMRYVHTILPRTTDQRVLLPSLKMEKKVSILTEKIVGSVLQIYLAIVLGF